MIDVDIGTRITEIRQGKSNANISLLVYHCTSVSKNPASVQISIMVNSFVCLMRYSAKAMKIMSRRTVKFNHSEITAW